MKELEKTVDLLYEIPKFTTKNSLDHTRLFMERLGNPGFLRKVIHVAGSNGKGSVCNFLYHMLLEGKKSVGLFISPHLVDIRERFQVNGALCDKDAYLRAFYKVKETAEEMVQEGIAHPTFFEMLYAIGMLIFEDADVEYIILETGLGGRLDATNTCPSPILCVITSISLEHTEYLGDTIEQIAAEKGGIIKAGVPVVYDASDDTAARTIQAIAEERNCMAFPISKKSHKNLKIRNNCIDFSYCSTYDRESEWRIPFSAPYQVWNASLAICAMEQLQILTQEQMQSGMAKAFWPGRMQEIRPDVYLDGAHNPSGVSVFLDAVEHLTQEDRHNPLLLFSMVKEKDYHTAIASITDRIDWDMIAVTRIPDDRGISFERLQEIFEADTDNEVIGFADYKEAFDAMSARKKKGQKLFCTGSLYFVGALLDYVSQKD